MTTSQQHAIKDQDKLKPGDTVMHGGKGPFVIQSLGSQLSMFGPEVEVAILEDGSFVEVGRLRKVECGA